MAARLSAGARMMAAKALPIDAVSVGSTSIPLAPSSTSSAAAPQGRETISGRPAAAASLMTSPHCSDSET
jgi:hypothetical protein